MRKKKLAELEKDDHLIPRAKEPDINKLKGIEIRTIGEEGVDFYEHNFGKSELKDKLWSEDKSFYFVDDF